MTKTRIKKWNRTISKYIPNKALLGVIFLFLAAWFVSTFFWQVMLLQGVSMEPAYHSGQFLILDRHTGEYTYGDVVAVEKEGIEGYLVKRIVALPGDRVCIREGLFYVNGEAAGGYLQDIAYAGIAARELLLGEDQFFVLGDNLAESRDSRYPDIGAVDRNEIRGKVIR